MAGTVWEGQKTEMGKKFKLRTQIYQTKTQVLGDGNACIRIRIPSDVKMLDPDLFYISAGTGTV